MPSSSACLVSKSVALHSGLSSKLTFEKFYPWDILHSTREKFWWWSRRIPSSSAWLLRNSVASFYSELSSERTFEKLWEILLVRNTTWWWCRRYQHTANGICCQFPTPFFWCPCPDWAPWIWPLHATTSRPLLTCRYVGVCRSVLRSVGVCCKVLRGVVVCCGVLRVVVVCWSVLQCVAVCCSVLLWISVSRLSTIPLNYAYQDITAFADLPLCCSVLQRVTRRCSVF